MLIEAENYSTQQGTNQSPGSQEKTIQNTTTRLKMAVDQNKEDKIPTKMVGKLCVRE